MNVFVRSVAAVALLALLTCFLTGCGGSKDKMMDDKKMNDGKMMDGKMNDGKMMDDKDKMK